MQNEYIAVEKSYLVDLTSPANRDIYTIEKGSIATRYVYGIDGKRISAEFDYAENTHRGEPGENISSDKAVDIGKIYYRSNQLNSSTYILNKDGTTRAHIIYDEWGKPLTPTNQGINNAAVENVNNFTGYTYDEVLGIYYAQARFYNPEIKRFLTIDPLKDRLNWYAYCESNPVNKVDMYGTTTLNFNGQRYDIGNSFEKDGNTMYAMRKVVAAVRNMSENDAITKYGKGYAFYLWTVKDGHGENGFFEFQIKDRINPFANDSQWLQVKQTAGAEQDIIWAYFNSKNNTTYMTISDIAKLLGIGDYYEVYYANDEWTIKKKSLTEEQKIFISTVYGEAASCSIEGQRAIANVVMNRVKGKRDNWANRNTVLDVIKNTGFDAYTHKNSPYKQMENYLNNRTYIDNKKEELIWVVLHTMDGTWSDNTGGCVLYYSPRAQQQLYGKAPNWDFSQLEKVDIWGAGNDDLAFYRYK
jgi:RHS repeat-associated protein